MADDSGRFDGEYRREEDHPELSPEEHREQRGTDPDGAIGGQEHAPDPTEYDPGWVGDPGSADPWQEWIREHGREHRPHREDVLPYLLIRAFAPGDRAQRPTWPPRPSWLSPDILLMDADDAGPFDPGRLVDSPQAGRSYRVFVHVWNLGLVSAIGVLVRAWHVSPGYFAADGLDDSYVPEPIGAAFVDLGPRTAGNAHALVELQTPWFISPALSGHECLLASATCPADTWAGTLDANRDRHVGQRNVTILGPGQSVRPLLGVLGERVLRGGFLEVVLRWVRDREPVHRPLFVGAMLDEGFVVVAARSLGAEGEGIEPGLLAHRARRLGNELVGLDATSSLSEAFVREFGDEELLADGLLERMELERADLDFAQFTPDGDPSGGYTIRLQR
jgi:hypothetical protein